MRDLRRASARRRFFTQALEKEKELPKQPLFDQQIAERLAEDLRKIMAEYGEVVQSLGAIVSYRPSLHLNPNLCFAVWVDTSDSTAPGITDPASSIYMLGASARFHEAVNNTLQAFTKRAVEGYEKAAAEVQQEESKDGGAAEVPAGQEHS